MQLIPATVAADGQLHLSEELTSALGVPHGGEIEIMLCDNHVELRKKRPSATFLDAASLLGTLHATSSNDAEARARREDEDYARRTSGC